MTVLILLLEINNNSDVSISINNVLGQSLVKENYYIKDLYKEIDISTYGSGVYFVNIEINDQLFVKQLIVE